MNSLSLRDRFYLWRMKLKSKFRALLLGESVKALLVDTNQGVFVVDPLDMGVGNTLLQNGSYDEETLRKWCEILNDQSSVLVVGGHIGSLAVPLSKSCAHVDVIEANPETFKLLSYNVGINNCDNIKLHNYAAGESTGELEMLVSRVNSGGSKRKPKTESLLYTYDNPEVIKVPMVVLDDHLLNKNYELIIMDIEGSEYFALKGMSSLLSKCRYLQIEYLGHHLENVANVSKQEFFALITKFFRNMELNSELVLVEGIDIHQIEDGDLVFSK